MSENLVKRIESLQTISAQLEPEENLRKQYLDEVSQLAGQFLSKLDDLPAYRADRETQGVFGMDGKPVPVSEILDIYSREIIHKGIKPASAGHIGYIPGGGIYTSALADFLSDVTNVYSGIYYAGPGAVALENELLDWLKGVFGFPGTAVGNFTSGGSIANLIALTAARDKYGIKGAKISKSVIYLSDQVHHCIYKALRIIGLEDVTLRSLEMDEYSRIRLQELRNRIESDQEEGLNPFMIIASAGTTDTGAIDPLEEIGKLAEEFKLWFHVDAAYGGFFILTESRRERFRGIERADSLVVDPHKGLFLPYGLGAVLVKDREAVFHSHHYLANYMQDSVDEQNLTSPADVSPELTRPFRGLRLWMPLKLHGLEPFVACLEEKLLLTEYFRKKLAELGFEIGPEPDLSVSYFWYPAKDMDQNLFNRKLMEAIHRDGAIFLSSSTINGRFVIRIALLSFRTKLHTIDKAVEMIKRAMKQVTEMGHFPG